MSPKKIIRLVLINLGSLLLTAKIIPGIKMAASMKTAIYAAVALTVINFLIKPLLKILLLPVNILTLGTFRWLVNVLILYILVRIIPSLTINAFQFPGFQTQNFAIASFFVPTFWAYVLTSFSLSLWATITLWLIK